MSPGNTITAIHHFTADENDVFVIGEDGSGDCAVHICQTDTAHDGLIFTDVESLVKLINVLIQVVSLLVWIKAGKDHEQWTSPIEATHKT